LIGEWREQCFEAGNLAECCGIAVNPDLFGKARAYSGEIIDLFGGNSQFIAFFAIVFTVTDSRFGDQKMIFF